MSYLDTERRLDETGTVILRLEDGFYEWDQIDVWRRDDGRLFLYADGGCSCDGPYMSVSGWDDLRPLTSIEQFTAAVDDAYFIKPRSDELIRHVKTVSDALREAPRA